jgi:hypothetical protein
MAHIHMVISISIESFHHDDLHLHIPCAPSSKWWVLQELQLPKSNYIVRSDHHRLARRPLHKLAIHLAPAILHNLWHARSIPITHDPAKKKLGATTSKLWTPETPSSKPFLEDLISKKCQKGWISCVKFFVDEFSYKIHLNPSSYAKVMAILPNRMFLQLPQPGSRSNLPAHASYASGDSS